MKLFEAPIFLLLLAIYPIMAVIAENVDWGVSAGEVVMLVVLSLLTAVAGWPVAQRARSSRFMNSTAILLWIAFWLWYGAFIQLFASLIGKPGPDAYILAFPFWLLSLAILGILLERSRLLSRSTRYLNLFSSILLLFPALTLMRGPSVEPLRWDSQPLPPSSGISITSPDIYFIILDGYSSIESLGTLWRHDNHPFADSLEQRGFFLPKNSHSNYVHTHLSLASMLNWAHLLELRERVGTGRDRSYTYAMIENNRAARFLQSLGYEFVFLPTTFPGTDRNRLADRQIPSPPTRERNWAAIWFAQTPATALVHGICELLECQPKRFPYPVETSENYASKFKILSQLAHEPGPKFVLVHLLLPHVPYVLREDCSGREPSWPSSGDPSHWPQVQQRYVEQLTCLNQMLLKLVDDLLARSFRPPIVILQADHGHGRTQLDPLTNATIPLEDLQRIDIDDRTRVFAAYHLPGLDHFVMYDSITPVNVLPIVFNSYFGTDIVLENDETYWSEYRQSYVFKRIKWNGE